MISADLVSRIVIVPSELQLGLSRARWEHHFSVVDCKSTSLMSLSAKGLTVSRRGKNIIDDVDVTIEVGQLSAVIGPNGAGKSTLLSGLAGDLAPSKGVVTIDDKPIKILSGELGKDALSNVPVKQHCF